MARRTPRSDLRPRSGETGRGRDAGCREPTHEAAPGGAPTPRDTAVTVLLSLAIAIASLVVYGQLASHAFIHFDDNIYIYENPQVRTGLS